MQNKFLTRQLEFFDGTKQYSHLKKGVVAYTINTEGEISAFTHLSGRESRDGLLFHSSMNAGKAVFCAGELQINSQGELLTITTRSGHYRPSTYNLYKFLQHLESQRVDISNVKVRGIEKPPKGVEYTVNKDSFIPVYEYKATDLYEFIKHSLQQNIKSFSSYGQSGVRSFLYSTFGDSELTSSRQELAKGLYTELDDFLTRVKSATCFEDIQTLSNDLTDIISKYETLNNQLSTKNGKESGSGRLAKLMNEMRSELKAISSVVDDSGSKISNKMKSGAYCPLLNRSRPFPVVL
jgi:hypothetical protein